MHFHSKKKEKKKKKKRKTKEKKRVQRYVGVSYSIDFFVVGFVSGGLSEIFMRDELRESSLRRVLFISYDFPIRV